jgi:plastocyanin
MQIGRRAAVRLRTPLPTACIAALVLVGCGGGTLAPSASISTGVSPVATSAGSASPEGSPGPGTSPSTAITVTPPPTPVPALSGSPAGAVAVEMAGPPPHFAPNDLTFRAGDIVLALKNTSQAAHNLAIGAAPLSLKTDRVANALIMQTANVAIGASATFRLVGLRPGAYVFWCTIGDHAALGMTGTLTVTP